MLFLDWMFEDRDIKWLTWLERPLANIGQLNQLSVVLSVVALVVLASTLAEDPAVVLTAGSLGLVTYLLVNGLGELFDEAGHDQMEEVEADAEESAPLRATGPGRPQLAKATGKAGFFLFLYLEVLDAAFSFDGVIGAFAITTDPILIALGLGLIGAMFVRSLTVFLVRKGTLQDYVYLEHGAHWAIGALAVILLIGIGYHVNEIVTGLDRRRLHRRGVPVQHHAQPQAGGAGLDDPQDGRASSPPSTLDRSEPVSGPPRPPPNGVRVTRQHDQGPEGVAGQARRRHADRGPDGPGLGRGEEARPVRLEVAVDRPGRLGAAVRRRRQPRRRRVVPPAAQQGRLGAAHRRQPHRRGRGRRRVDHRRPHPAARRRVTRSCSP